jgi:hypothetical protein
MAFEPGKEKTGGRSKGTPNETTAKAKELILQAIDSQSVHFDETMTKLKEKDPRSWAQIMVKLMDFVLPKKIDLTSDGKGITTPVVSWAKEDNGGTTKS